MLGGEQSGFIADIGFETYNRILNEAMQELKETEYPDLFPAKETIDGEGENVFVEDCQIDTDLELLFPEEYVSNISERMNLYRELDQIQRQDELQLFEKGLIDRFGPLPGPSRDLLAGG